MKVYIPEPCQENWSAMKPTEIGKFCASCKTEVVDFTAMNKAEIQQYFSTNCNKNFCGKYTLFQTSIAKSASVLTKIKYFTLLTIGFILPQSCMGKQMPNRPTEQEMKYYDSIEKVNQKVKTNSIVKIKKVK